jgi:polyphenol oxidase
VHLIEPDWPAPPRVRACSTTRDGGVSRGAYASLNLGDHVGDDLDQVILNRELVRRHLRLSEEPLWLKQVHGCTLVLGEGLALAHAKGNEDCEADGSLTSKPGVVCVVMTADCLPVLMCDDCGTRVAALHAGWRGLASGILERAVESMQAGPARLLVWLGPAIGPEAFEVGPEVRARFVAEDERAVEAFRPSPRGAYRCDLVALARQRLVRLGVTGVYGGGYCTFSDRNRFFSYRRDGVTGRMASLIWLDPDAAVSGDTIHA